MNTGGRIVPRFQELTTEKLGKVYLLFISFKGFKRTAIFFSVFDILKLDALVKLVILNI